MVQVPLNPPTQVELTATTISETKPGYKTTEFWLTLILIVGGVLDETNAWHFMPHNWAAIGMAVVAGAYSLSRGKAKQGIPYEAPTK